MEAEIGTSHLVQPTRGLATRMLGDERLAQQVAGGNERAFTILFERYHQQLYRYCRSLTGNEHDAQDALQSALAKALVALRAGRRNAPVRPWLFRIAHNESISIIRARSVAAELPLDLEAARLLTDTVEERERFTALLSDLRRLPEQQRGALVMRELSGLSHEEIAVALEVSTGAAKQSILEARRSLLEFAEGRAMACEEIQRIISDDDRRSLRSRRVRAHLSDCATCTAFAEAIPRRRADMLALWPVLPAAGSVGLLAKLTGAGSGHGGGGAGLVAGTAAKGIGVTISAKVAVVAGAAAIATAGVGAVAILHHHAPAGPVSGVSGTGGSGGSGQSAPAHFSGVSAHGSATAAGFAYRPGRSTRHSAVAAISSPGSASAGNGHAHGGHGSRNPAASGHSPMHGSSSAGHGRSSAAGRSTAGHHGSNSSAAATHSQSAVHRRSASHVTAGAKSHRRVVKPRRHLRHHERHASHTGSHTGGATSNGTATNGKSSAGATKPSTTTTTTTTQVTTRSTGSPSTGGGSSGTSQAGGAAANKKTTTS